MKASIIALRFLAMREKKQMFAVRLVPVAKRLIKAEAKATGCSEAEVVERWALAHSKSGEAHRILVDHAKADPMISAVVEAMSDHPKKPTSAANGADPPRRSRRSAA